MLLPLAFCRECGQEYLVVWRRDGARHGQLPGPPRRHLAARTAEDAPPTPTATSTCPRTCRGRATAETVVADRRAARVLAGGQRPHRARTSVRPTARQYLPVPVTVDAYGHEGPAEAASRRRSSRRRSGSACAAGSPTSRQRGSDFAKLATLDQEGRSSATTLISMSIVRSLRAVPDEALDANARKLLTFVDNRQDAALQAGHFNDFVEVTHGPRRAVPGRASRRWQTARRACSTTTSPAKVTRALGLAPEEYAHAPRRGPGAAQAHRRRRCATWSNLRVLPRPGARLAGHDAQPGAGRPARDRLPGPGRRRGQRRAVAGLPSPPCADAAPAGPRAGLPRAAR